MTQYPAIKQLFSVLTSNNINTTNLEKKREQRVTEFIALSIKDALKKIEEVGIKGLEEYEGDINDFKVNLLNALIEAAILHSKKIKSLMHYHNVVLNQPPPPEETTPVNKSLLPEETELFKTIKTFANQCIKELNDMKHSPYVNLQYRDSAIIITKNYKINETFKQKLDQLFNMQQDLKKQEIEKFFTDNKDYLYQTSDFTFQRRLLNLRDIYNMCNDKTLEYNDRESLKNIFFSEQPRQTIKHPHESKSTKLSLQ
jgi:hypothetical protein